MVQQEERPICKLESAFNCWRQLRFGLLGCKPEEGQKNCGEDVAALGTKAGDQQSPQVMHAFSRNALVFFWALSAIRMHD